MSEMNDTQARDKWNKIYKDADEAQPVEVVVDNIHLAPAAGRGLELACGLAANSMFLAEHGLTMEAWDISAVAIERVNNEAQRRALAVTGEARDVVTAPPQSGAYDVVVVSYFLDRTLVAPIVAALKPGGLLYYQTFTQTRVHDSGPRSEAFRLADGELLTLFAELRPLVYREEGRVGDLSKGYRDEAMLVAQKMLVSRCG